MRSDPIYSPWRHQLLGWGGVFLSTLFASFWAFWGVIENFHEGWYYRSLWMNIGLMCAQYLLPAVLFTTSAVAAIRWPRIGAAIHLAAAGSAAWFFRGASRAVVYPFILAPLLLMGICYWFGRPQPRRRAIGVVVGLPIITVFAFGAAPAYKVSRRLDDGHRSARRVTQNGVDLIWAPEGPGWPDEGVTWEEAMRRCQYLRNDGRHLSERPQNVWRLPTTDEAVRCMQHHGNNSGGSWDAVHAKASYGDPPDKESPLWNVHSKIIYWWTATEVGDEKAHVLAYNGQVRAQSKRSRWGYLGFRAVKNLTSVPKSGT